MNSNDSRINISCSKKFSTLTRQTAKKQGLTLVEFIRRAIIVYIRILNEMSNNNSHLQVVNDDTQTVKELVLFD